MHTSKLMKRFCQAFSNICTFNVIRATGSFRTRWDILIIILSLWVCFTLPVHIAFEPEGLDSMINQVFNTVIDVLYGIDIILNFRTSFINPLTGDEVIEAK